MALLLIGTVLTGFLLLAVVLWIARGIDWRSNDLIVDRGDADLLGALANSPAVWVAAFLGLALGLTGVAIVAVLDVSVVELTGIGLPEDLAKQVLELLPTLATVAIGSVVLFYLVGGTYVAVRSRNVSSAAATLAVAIVLGTLLMVAIAGKLLMGP